MVISNLNYLESVSEENMVKGGYYYGYGHYGRGRGFNFDFAANFANITQVQVGGENNTQFAAIGQNANA